MHGEMQIDWRQLETTAALHFSAGPKGKDSMYPLGHGADYAAIERRAHELRRQAMQEMFGALAQSIVRGVRGLQDLVARVMLRQRRAAGATFFNAQ